MPEVNGIEAPAKESNFHPADRGCAADIPQVTFPRPDPVEVWLVPSATLRFLQSRKAARVVER